MDGILCKIQVGDCIPILSPAWQLHPNLVKIIHQEFIPNSTYFTNGTIVLACLLHKHKHWKLGVYRNNQIYEYSGKIAAISWVLKRLSGPFTIV